MFSTDALEMECVIVPKCAHLRHTCFKVCSGTNHLSRYYSLIENILSSRRKIYATIRSFSQEHEFISKKVEIVTILFYDTKPDTLLKG